MVAAANLSTESFQIDLNVLLPVCEYTWEKDTLRVCMSISNWRTRSRFAISPPRRRHPFLFQVGEYFVIISIHNFESVYIKRLIFVGIFLFAIRIALIIALASALIFVWDYSASETSLALKSLLSPTGPLRGFVILL